MKRQGYSDFDITSLAGTVIKGIEVLVHAKSSIAGKTLLVRIYSDSEAAWSDPISMTFGTSEEEQSYGGATNVWGTSWIAADFANDKFYLSLETIAGEGTPTLSVDCLMIKVYRAYFNTSIRILFYFCIF